MSCNDIIFHVGSYNDFRLTLQTCENGITTADDVSSATSITVAVITRETPYSVLASVAATSGFADADWANGIVTGAFTNSDSAGITEYGWKDILVTAVISSQNHEWLFEKAVNVKGPS